ncbi:MAG: hypothetical protein WA988_07275, partial [Candidatus Nanopelagicales bacterium]
MGPEGGTVELAADVRLVVPSGALSETVEVSAAELPQPSELPEGVTAERILNIQLDGVAPTKPVRVQFSGVDADSLAGPEGAAVGYHEGPDGVEFLDADVDVDKKTVTVETSSLSPLGYLRISSDKVREQLGGVLRTSLGDAVFGVDDPKCEGEDEARGDGWTVNSTDSRTVKWCMGMDEGDRVITLANNRRYPLVVRPPGGTTLRDRSDRGFAARVSEATLPNDRVVLGGGEDATWVLEQEPGISGTFQAELDGLAQSVVSIEVAAEWLELFASKVPRGKSATKDTLLAVVENSGCLGALVDQTDSESSFGGADIAKLVLECLSYDNLREWVGTFGANLLIAPVGLTFGT